MRLRSLEDLRNLLDSMEGSLLGVGISPFPRMLPARLTNSYRILCLKKTLDLPILRQDASILCLEEAYGGLLPSKGANTEWILAHPLAAQLLKPLPRPIYFYIYQGYPGLEEMAARLGGHIIANPGELRLRLRTRRFFEDLVGHLGLPRIQGGPVPLSAFLETSYREWHAQLGEKFVVQLEEVAQGGGRGTFFVASLEELEALKQRLRGGLWRGIRLSRLVLRRFIKGTAASIALCITSQGLLFSRLQRQIIDLFSRTGLSESGIFCGHSWGEEPWDQAAAQTARASASRIGAHLASKGYRGILGIDFVVEEKTQIPYPVEINPRLTAAFPVLSLLQLSQGIIPLEAFHLLEFLALHYKADLRELNAHYQEPFEGGQILLMGAMSEAPLRPSLPRPGLYRFFSCGQGWVGPTWDLGSVGSEGDCLLLDGPPEFPDISSGGRPDPLSRLGRLIFTKPVLSRNGRLLPRAAQALEAMERALFLESETPL